METSIQEELKKFKEFELSPSQILESYKHIVLNDQEMIEALLWAKRKKETQMQQDSIRQKQYANQKMFSNKMSFDIIRTFMAARAVEITRKELVLDDDNSDVFDLLCYYFIDDEEGFLKKCRLLEVNNPDIKKGILLAGNVGTGKTYLMDLFRKNQRQVYFTRDSKKIVNDFMAAKDDEIPEEYLKPFMLRINDPQTLYQPCAGMCIDDLGKETMKNKYGNKMNVIGDLIEERYSAGYTGVFLHATTNLSVPELTDHYGERVVSRISETFNMIVLEGNDRRRG